MVLGAKLWNCFSLPADLSLLKVWDERKIQVDEGNVAERRALLPSSVLITDLTCGLSSTGKPENFLGHGQHEAALAVLLFLTPEPCEGNGKRQEEQVKPHGCG